MLTVLKESLVILVTKGIMQILYFSLPIHTYLKATFFHLRHIAVLRGIEGSRHHVVIILHLCYHEHPVYIERDKQKGSIIRENVEEVVGIVGEKLVEVTATFYYSRSSLPVAHPE
jgi:hypothetical protein